MRTLVDLMGILSSEELDVLQNGGSEFSSYGDAIECTATPQGFYFLSFLRKRKFGLFKPKIKTERKKTA